MDTKKYIIEIPDNTAWLQWVKVSDKDGHVYFDFKDPEDLTLYTEPDVERNIEEAFKNGYDAACKDIDVKSKTNATYRKGLEDAWDAARKIAKLNTDEQKRLFGCFGIYFVAHEFSASEAIEKIRQYEEQEDTEFHVGDEFVTKNNKDFGVIVAVNAKRVLVLWKDDADIVDENNREFTTKWAKERFSKTGRNFPEIAEVFKKMQEVRE